MNTKYFHTLSMPLKLSPFPSPPTPVWVTGVTPPPRALHMGGNTLPLSCRVPNPKTRFSSSVFSRVPDDPDSHCFVCIHSGLNLLGSPRMRGEYHQLWRAQGQEQQVGEAQPGPRSHSGGGRSRGSCSTGYSCLTWRPGRGWCYLVHLARPQPFL